MPRLNFRAWRRDSKVLAERMRKRAEAEADADGE